MFSLLVLIIYLKVIQIFLNKSILLIIMVLKKISFGFKNLLLNSQITLTLISLCLMVYGVQLYFPLFVDKYLLYTTFSDMGFYKIFTTMFVHNGIEHLRNNLLTLFLTSMICENFLKKSYYLKIILIFVILRAFFVIFMYENICGISGLTYFFKFLSPILVMYSIYDMENQYYQKVYNETKLKTKKVLLYVFMVILLVREYFIYNEIITEGIYNVAFYSHWFGLFCGIVFGIYICAKETEKIENIFFNLLLKYKGIKN